MVTWLQPQVCCGGCWCLIWLAVGSWGIWRGVDQHLHPAVRFPPKKRLEMAIWTEGGAWCLTLTYSVGTDPITWEPPCLSISSKGHQGETKQVLGMMLGPFLCTLLVSYPGTSSAKMTLVKQPPIPALACPQEADVTW